MKKTILNLCKNKLNNIKSVGITSYDFPFSKIVNKTPVDFVIVGDTLGSTVYGVNNLNKVNMDTMINHCKAVSRGADSKFLIGDMPFGSYQPSNKDAINNAARFNRSGMDAVKIEGFFPERVRSVSDSGVLVMSHLGLTPQTKAKMGGYKIQGKTSDEASKLLDQARIVQDNGASLLLLEAVPTDVAKVVRDELEIPVYGIGAGKHTDGQLVIVHDLLGLFWDFKPRFVKQYVNLEKTITDTVELYSNDVKNMNFPDNEHSYSMKNEELDKFLQLGSTWKYIKK
jgi:3-methyl-2-oxobutanoate hydroxymethyltransferase